MNDREVAVQINEQILVSNLKHALIALDARSRDAATGLRCGFRCMCPCETSAQGYSWNPIMPLREVVTRAWSPHCGVTARTSIARLVSGGLADTSAICLPLSMAGRLDGRMLAKQAGPNDGYEKGTGDS